MKEIDHHELARVTKAFKDYYALAEPHKTEENHVLWLQTLSENNRQEFTTKGFHQDVHSFLFMRYVLERNGIQLDEFMKANLSETDYKGFKNPSRYLSVPWEMNVIDKKEPWRFQ